MGNQIIPDQLNGLPNVGGKVGHYRRTDTYRIKYRTQSHKNMTKMKKIIPSLFLSSSPFLPPSRPLLSPRNKASPRFSFSSDNDDDDVVIPLSDPRDRQRTSPFPKAACGRRTTSVEDGVSGSWPMEYAFAPSRTAFAVSPRSRQQCASSRDLPISIAMHL